MTFIPESILDMYEIYPTLFHFLGIVLLGYFGGLLIKKTIIKISKITHIDKMMKDSKLHIVLKELGYRNTVIVLFADLTKYFVYILAISSMFEIIGLNEMSAFFSAIINYIPNIALAGLILIVGSFVADLFGKIVSELISDENKKKDMSSIIAVTESFTRIMLYVVAFIIALNVLGFDPTAITVVMGFILLTASALLILSLKDLAPNFMAGIEMKNMGLKDKSKVALNGISGEIVYLGTFNTTIKGARKTYVIPNSNFITNGFEKVQ